MWGNKSKNIKQSEFYLGESIFKRLYNSLYGIFRNTFQEIFNDNEIAEFTLPKVILIGNESHGKSSLLENITKCQIFPRDSKLCTKTPIHVVMNNGTSKFRVEYKNNQTDFTNKYDIYDLVKQYMDELSDISEDEIKISITDSNMPNFEFYDLPGLIAYPECMAKKSYTLTRKYIEDKNAIVLCVVSATTPRLTCCQSIALIKELGIQHNTIMALTMVDRLQPETIEDLLINRIINKSDEIKDLDFAGCYGIINRLHISNCTLDENDNIERQWFQENILSDIPESYLQYKDSIVEHLTLSKLLCAIDKLYNDFIKNDWKPKVLKQINEKIIQYEQEYTDLGDIDVSSTEVIEFIMDDFNKLITTILDDTSYTNFGSIIVDDLNQFVNDWYDDAPEEYNFFIKLPVLKGKYYKFCNVSEYMEYYFDEFSSTFITSLCIDRYFIYTLPETLIDFIKDYKSMVLESDIFIDRINDLFESDTKYMLERFESLRIELINYLNNKIIEICDTKFETFLRTAENHIIYTLTNTNITDKAECLSTLIASTNKLFKLQIIYPLYYRYIEFEHECIESDEYKEKREKLSQLISKTKDHMVKIENSIK